MEAAITKPVVPWSAIRTVFLDMDGTLLDLHFDNHFWLEHLPARFAESHGMQVKQALAHLMPLFHSKQGTLDWYCLDYWSRELGVDILALKQEVAHLIRFTPRAEEFLVRVRAAGKRLVLVTNAHAHSLALKVARTGLDAHFDRLVSSHTLGAPKEDSRFWVRLSQLEPYQPESSLLVDDSLPVLAAARAHGLAHAIAIAQPDSRRDPRLVQGFPAVENLAGLLDGLQQ